MPNCQGIKQAGAVSFYKFFSEAISKKSAVFPFSPTFPSKIHTFPARFGATYDCGENPRKETERKRITMKNSNELNVPQAREAMDKFKMQAAQEMGVNLKQGYNGDLTSREAGSVGGQMVKKMCSVRSAKYDRQNRIAMGHVQTVQYIAAITV